MIDETTLNEEDFDFNDIDEDAQVDVKRTYPMLHWRHGKQELAELGESHPNYKGGVYWPDFPGNVPENWVFTKFKNGNGKMVDAYAISSIHISVIRWRTKWIKEQNCSKTHALCFMKGYDDPVIIAFNRKAAGKGFEAAYNANLKVLEEVNKNAPMGKQGRVNYQGGVSDFAETVKIYY